VRMDAAQVQKQLEYSADEDFILTAWQYRMMQRDIAASKGKHLFSKRDVRSSFRRAAVHAIAERKTNDWSLKSFSACWRAPEAQILRRWRTQGRRSHPLLRNAPAPSCS
jgi:hypothetical protein